MNPQTPKAKKYFVRTCITVLCCCRLLSTEEVPFKNILSKKSEALFSKAWEISGRTLRKEGWPHRMYKPCQRKLKRFNEFKAKIGATQEWFQRGN